VAIGQSLNGSTVNATIGVDSLSGEYRYTFTDPAFDMLISLTNSSGIIVDTTMRAQNDEILLQASSYDNITTGNGNDTFVVAATSSDLGGNVLHGGPAGVNVIQLLGSNATIDLTGVSAGTAASTGIDAVVARKATAKGETVDLKLTQLGASTLTDGGTGPGKAFVALLGANGAVNVTAGGGFQIVGVLNAAGVGYSAAGAALNATDTAALAAQVTRIDDVQGTLTADYVGSANTPLQTAAVNSLSAYVFSNGSTSYTIWSDGVASQLNATGGLVQTAYHPGSSTAPSPVLGVFDQFSKADSWAAGKLGLSPAGLTTLKLSDGSSLAYAAIQVKAGASGTAIRGDSGANGGDWFGLGGSGGLNQVYGSRNGDIFDLQLSTSLQDYLHGNTGFDVVLGKAIGTDIDLTANNGSTAVAVTSIEAAVGSGGKTQTVEVNPNALAITTDSTGAKTAVFEAMLGGDAGDALTLEGPGKWMQIATFAPGSALPTHATTLTGATILDGLYGGSTHTAENSMTGYLFEDVGAKGVPLKFVTIYSDSAINNQMAAPSAALMAQALAQLSAQGWSATSSLTQNTSTNSPVTLTPPG
jgi:hypothetical protein